MKQKHSNINDFPIDEVLTKKDSVSKWISDFVKSDNPKFAGKTKKERIKMALGAFYSNQRNEDVGLGVANEAISPREKISRIMKMKRMMKTPHTVSHENCKMCGSADVKTYSQGDNQCNSCNFSWTPKKKNESFEVTDKKPIDELKSSTLRSYADKISNRMQTRYSDLISKGGDVEEYNKDAKKDLVNMNKALDKAAKKTLVPSQARYEEVSLEEMDKSAPQPGRDGKVSHRTYGSRDKKESDYFKGKEAPGKPVTAKQVAKDALDILKKQGVAEEMMFEGSHRPGFVAITINHDMSPEGKAGNKYTVSFKPDKKSPLGRTKYVDISHHKNLEDAKRAKEEYVKKHAAAGVVALRGIGEETIDEISQNLKASYKEKALAQMKELKPYAKKGAEYGDLARNVIAKRKAGIKKVTEEVLDEELSSRHQTFDSYHKQAQNLLKKLSAKLDAHKKSVHKPIKNSVGNTSAFVSSGDIYDIKNLHRTLQDLHDSYSDTVDSAERRVKPISTGGN
jgi:ElaB/YqjD/DUF883 family membrane-anchored ribosome-binding protein/ribosomal protein L37E